MDLLRRHRHRRRAGGIRSHRRRPDGGRRVRGARRLLAFVPDPRARLDLRCARAGRRGVLPAARRACGRRACLDARRAAHRMPADPRRIGRLAGRGRGPLRRHGRAPAVVGGRGTLAGRDRRGAGRGDGRGLRLRAFRRRRAQARRTLAPHGCRAWCPARCRDVRRGRDRLPRRRRRRPEDRFLSRPAREPGRRARARRRPRGAQCVLLHGSLHAGGACGRGDTGRFHRQLGRRARPRPRKPRAQSGIAGRPRDMVRSGSIRRAAQAARPRCRIRSRRARSAEVRTDRRARRARRPRLQGHQSAGLETAAARVDCSRRFRARAASTPSCFARSSPARRSMPGSTLRSSAVTGRAPIIRSPSRFRKGNT